MLSHMCENSLLFLLLVRKLGISKISFNGNFCVVLNSTSLFVRYILDAINSFSLLPVIVIISPPCSEARNNFDT